MGVDQGKESSKVKWVCTICHPYRWSVADLIRTKLENRTSMAGKRRDQIQAKACQNRSRWTLLRHLPIFGPRPHDDGIAGWTASSYKHALRLKVRDLWQGRHMSQKPRQGRTWTVPIWLERRRTRCPRPPTPGCLRWKTHAELLATFMDEPQRADDASFGGWRTYSVTPLEPIMPATTDKGAQDMMAEPVKVLEE